MQHTNLAEIVDFEPYPRTALASKPKGPNNYTVTVVFWFDEEDQRIYSIHEIFFSEDKAVKYVEEYKDYYNLTWKTYPVRE